MGTWLLSVVKQYDNSVTPAHILRLEFEAASMNDALTWIVSHTLLFIWKKRSSGKKATMAATLAVLTTDNEILATTKHRNISQNIAVVLSAEIGNQNFSSQ